MSVTVLVVEDDEYVRSSLQALLASHGYRVLTAPDGASALHILQENLVDLVLTDLRIGPVDGLEVLAYARKQAPFAAVLMLTGYGSLDSAIRALREGADDYLLKPCDPQTLLERVQNALTKRRIVRECLSVHRAVDAALALARTLEVRQPQTYRHSQRVAHFAQQLAQQVGIPVESHLHLWLAGMLHDIGKLGVERAILSKVEPLSQEEHGRIRIHPVLSAHIVQPIAALRPIFPVILHHHERYDGRGYPDGLQGEAIPEGARLLAVVDSFAAMTEARPYRPARGLQEALALLEEGAGQQWDPNFVRAWVEWVREGKWDPYPPETPRTFERLLCSPGFGAPATVP
ncbi:MAG: HD-GYP domain-containing protein [Chloroflexia bacterium]